MFSAPSKFLRSQQRSFPAVVIPKDRQKVEFSFSSSPSTSLTGTSNPDNHHLKKEENSRVMQIAQRVDKILSEIGTTVRTAPSTSNNSIEEKTMIDIPSSTMTEQEKYIDDAESLLRGGSSSSSSSSSSVSAELAWANRILNQNKHDEETNTQAFSSSAPSQKDAMMDFLKMTSSSTTSSSSSTSSSVAKKNNNGKSLLDQLRNGNKPMLTETQQSELVDYLDSLVERRMDTFTSSQEEKSIGRDKTSQSTSANMMNDEKATDDDSAILKQARFLRALLNVRNLLENECPLGLPSGPSL